EAPGVSARIYQIEEKLECPCPSLYGENELNRDEERLEELSRVRQSGRKLSVHEDIEEAWLTARVALWSTVPEWAARGRFTIATSGGGMTDGTTGRRSIFASKQNSGPCRRRTRYFPSKRQS